MIHPGYLLIVGLLFITNVSVAHQHSDAITYAYFEDTSGTLELNQVKQKNFNIIDFDGLSFGLTNSAYWILINARVNRNDDWLLESCYTQIDKFDVYIEINNSIRTVNTGDTKDFSTRDVPHPCFVFELPELEHQKIYIRLESQGPLNIPIKLVESREFWEKNTQSQLLYGLLFAMLLLIIIHNLFLYVMFRHDFHINYVGYYIGILLFLSSMSGHAAMYLWPNSEFLGSYGTFFSLGLTGACGAQFVKYFCFDKKPYFKSRALLNFISAASVILAFVQIVNYALSLILFISLLALLIVVTFISLWFVAARENSVSANLAFLGYLMTFPGFALLLLSSLGFIEHSPLYLHLLQAGLIIKGLILSLAMAVILKDTHDRLDQQREQNILIKSQFAQNTIKEIDKVKHTLAREIHDGLAQNILAIRGQLQHLSPSSLKDDILDNMNISLNEIRNLAKQIHPQELEALGLVVSIKSMFERTLNPLGISIQYDTDDITNLLDKNTELQLYRIAQESLNNIVIHAKAKNVKLTLLDKQASILMKIENDGNGYRSIRNTGMGIQNMTERSAMINASFKIQNLNSTTIITVDAPYAD